MVQESMSEIGLLRPPEQIPAFDECFFYHTMEIPGHGVVKGPWDLRAGVDAYLGNVSFTNQRVLEIGPASGFLTFEMEKRGANVVSAEVTDDPGWDFVPYPAALLQEVFGPRRERMHRLKNSYWFAHDAHQSKAQVYYGDVYHLPTELGEFDIAVMGSVLLHLHSPLQVIAQCAQRARTIIITEKLYPDLEGKPICRLFPNPKNFSWGTWWNFSAAFFAEFLAVMGFSPATMTTHTQYHNGAAHTLFTIVATK
jgi:SAM-dependent methyltransferase